MTKLSLAKNISRLRKEKKITQEELANFLSITKASVSKWETEQSYPDILLLPQIASFFDVTIDELIGYEPKLSSNQIKVLYSKLAEDFSKEPFEEVFEKSRELTKKYYSCYDFLNQIIILWINHFNLAPNKEIQEKVLKEILDLCDHILKDCTDVSIYDEVILLKSMANIYLGKPKDVISDLEPILKNKKSHIEADAILIQAYQMIGDTSKAELHNQIIVYKDLMNLISNSLIMLNLKLNDNEFCEETIKRIKGIIEVYDVENLNSNLALQFSYNLAVFYALNNENKKALDELTKFIDKTIKFIEGGISLHGDKYFNRVEEWFEEFALKKEAPRNEKTVINSLIPAIEAPVFSNLFKEEGYKNLKIKIERKRGK